MAVSDALEEKKRILNEIVGSYLLKDILELEKVKGSKILLDNFGTAEDFIDKEIEDVEKELK